MSPRLWISAGVLAVALASGSASAVVAYDYGSSAGSVFVLNPPRPSCNADIGTLAPTPAGFTGWQIDSIVVARVNGSVAGTVDIGVFMWGGVNPAAPAGSSIFSSLLVSGVFSRTVSSANFNAIFTTTLTLTPGSLVMPGGSTFGIQMVYAQPGTINAATGAHTPNTIGVGGVYADQGLSGAGSSSNSFYVNNRTNGNVEASDITGFVAPNEAFGNVFLIINATAVPAPGATAVLGLAGLAAARRRRR